VINQGRTEGVIVTTIALAYLMGAWAIPHASVGDPLGATTFPVILGLAMLILGLSLTFAPDKGTAPISLKKSLGGIAVIAGLLGIYGYTLPLVGYPLGTFLFLSITARYLGEKSWAMAIGLSGGVSLGIFLLFTKALDLPLPFGVLEFLKG
jgi:putative tricarboxylic transport membrane protein